MPGVCFYLFCGLFKSAVTVQIIKDFCIAYGAKGREIAILLQAADFFYKPVFKHLIYAF